MDKPSMPQRRPAALPPAAKAFQDSFDVSEYGAGHVRLTMRRPGGTMPPRVRVPSRTIQNLRIAENVIWEIRSRHIPQMSNQISDMVQTGGECWARGLLLKPFLDSAGEYIDRIKILADQSIKARGGNAASASAIAFGLLASRRLNEPISIMHAHGLQADTRGRLVHQFVMIGDPRERKLEQLVVVDPWPIYPGAHTMNHAKFTMIGPILEHPPNTPFPAPAESLPVPLAEVNATLAAYRLPAVGTELTAWRILDQEKDSAPSVEQLFSTNAPDTIYEDDGTPGSRISLNTIPVEYWNAKQKGIVMTEAFRRKMPTFFDVHVKYSPTGYDL